MITYEMIPGSLVIEIRVSGYIENAELRSVMNRLRADLHEQEGLRILEIIDHFSGIEPAALWNDARLGIPLAQKVERVAVVADQAWVRAVTNLGAHFTSAEVRSFAPNEIAEARTWIGGAS